MEKLQLVGSEGDRSKLYVPSVIHLPPGLDYSDTLKDDVCQQVGRELEAYFETGALHYL